MLPFLQILLGKLSLPLPTLICCVEKKMELIDYESISYTERNFPVRVKSLETSHDIYSKTIQKKKLRQLLTPRKTNGTKDNVIYCPTWLNYKH